MEREDIIRMAREAGMGGGLIDERDVYNSIIIQLERFAQLVAEVEREACAKVCDDLADDYLKHYDPNDPAAGGAYESVICEECADVIRARGQQ